MTEAADLGKALQACAELYAAPLSQARAALYADVLKGYDIDRIRGAIRRHIQDPARGRFFPLPADIVAAMQADTEWWQKPAPPHPDLPAERADRPAIEDGTAGPVMDRRLGQRKFAELAKQLRDAPGPAPAAKPEQAENREAMRRARADQVPPRIEARHGEHAEAVARLAASVHAHEWRGILGRLHVVKASDIAVKLSFRSRTEVEFVENNFRQQIAEAFEVPVSAVQIVKGGRPPEEKPEEGKR